MVEVLSQIVARKTEDVASRLAGFDPSGVAPTAKSLRRALARSGARFVMEVKRASPSGHRSSRSPEEAMQAYAPVADAVSVLTDMPFFGGSLEDLRTVRAAFDGPILAKDFIVDPRQVTEARLHGADAVLCMLSVLDDETAMRVLAEADRLRMDVIVEVHDANEVTRALALGTKVIGINNRDLRTLTTDLAVTERLAPMVPKDVLLLSESGIASRADVHRLSHHVDAFLVGSSLMAAADITEAARALVHGRVKICGLTNVPDIEAAGQAGATHAGLVFVPETPRALDPQRAGPLADAAKRNGMKAVGVFRDSESAEVLRRAMALDLAAVQLHGREDHATIAAIQADFSGEVWTASNGTRDRGGDRPLFDNGAGGTGQALDWSILSDQPRLGSAFLAGGIGPDNALAAQATGVHGIDVGSRLEQLPGRKDPARLRELFDAVRPGDRRAA